MPRMGLAGLRLYSVAARAPGQLWAVFATLQAMGHGSFLSTFLPLGETALWLRPLGREGLPRGGGGHLSKERGGDVG